MIGQKTKRLFLRVRAESRTILVFFFSGVVVFWNFLLHWRVYVCRIGNSPAPPFSSRSNPGRRAAIGPKNISITGYTGGWAWLLSTWMLHSLWTFEKTEKSPRNNFS